jgi:hypothetical protein
VVRLKGDGSPEQYAAIHANVQKTSPNYSNIASAIQVNSTMVVL